MKDVAKTFAQYTVAGVGSVVGMLGGFWLWGNVIEGKLKKFEKDSENKFEEEGA